MAASRSIYWPVEVVRGIIIILFWKFSVLLGGGGVKKAKVNLNETTSKIARIARKKSNINRNESDE